MCKDLTVILNVNLGDINKEWTNYHWALWIFPIFGQNSSNIAIYGRVSLLLSISKY